MQKKPENKIKIQRLDLINFLRMHIKGPQQVLLHLQILNNRIAIIILTTILMEYQQQQYQDHLVVNQKQFVKIQKIIMYENHKLFQYG